MDEDSWGIFADIAASDGHLTRSTATASSLPLDTVMTWQTR
jgi:hypothetical protein